MYVCMQDAYGVLTGNVLLAYSQCIMSSSDCTWSTTIIHTYIEPYMIFHVIPVLEQQSLTRIPMACGT